MCDSEVVILFPSISVSQRTCEVGLVPEVWEANLSVDKHPIFFFSILMPIFRIRFLMKCHLYEQRQQQWPPPPPPPQQQQQRCTSLPYAESRLCASALCERCESTGDAARQCTPVHARARQSTPEHASARQSTPAHVST